MNSPIESGRHCCFLTKEPGLGIKIYTNEGLRDNSYENQKKAAEYGLGPEVYDKLNIEDFFAFFTEKVDMVDIDYDEINRVCIECSKIGIPITDSCSFNFTIHNNIPICIDFCISSYFEFEWTQNKMHRAANIFQSV